MHDCTSFLRSRRPRSNDRLCREPGPSLSYFNSIYAPWADINYQHQHHLLMKLESYRFQPMYIEKRGRGMLRRSPSFAPLSFIHPSTHPSTSSLATDSSLRHIVVRLIDQHEQLKQIDLVSTIKAHSPHHAILSYPRAGCTLHHNLRSTSRQTMVARPILHITLHQRGLQLPQPDGLSKLNGLLLRPKASLNAPK